MDDRSEQTAPSAALRGWVRRARSDCHMSLRELEAIADHIDRELVELPKDAHGEYICELTPIDSETWDVEQREEVVRCRDCKYYTPESMTREERGFGVYENMWEPGGCFNPERCSATWDSITEQMVPVGIYTDPDGFCSWGERRED